MTGDSMLLEAAVALNRTLAACVDHDDFIPFAKEIKGFTWRRNYETAAGQPPSSP